MPIMTMMIDDDDDCVFPRNKAMIHMYTNEW